MSYTNQNENETSEVHQREKQTDNWSRFSVALHILLPVAGLAIIFGQKHIFSRFLLQLDRNCVSVFCPSFSRREKLLKWAGSRLPQTWSSQSRTLSGGISELWADGSLLCTLINSAIPGACLNPHRHWKKPPLHAQAIAYKYLGIVPVFTEKDLLGDLTAMLEKNFLNYLNEIQASIFKLTERNELNRVLSTQYLARGMGLYTGEQHRKTIFYVYPNTKPTICNNSNIIIHIRGPYGTYGKAIIPKFHNDLFSSNDIKFSPDLITKNVVSKKKNPFIKNLSLPFMQYHKKHMGDNIVIHVTMQEERAKVTYIPKNYGMYEIIMISNGELIIGCPFNVHILNNTSGIQETLEIEEKEEEIPHPRKRKVISKTIDFINEQMPIADLQNKYNNKEKTRKSTCFKEVVDEITKQRCVADMNDITADNLDDSVLEDNNNNASNSTYKKESFKMLQDSRIEEETDEALSQAGAINNNEIDSFKTNDDNVIDEHSSTLEKQNLEYDNENPVNKLPSSGKQNSEHISKENREIDVGTSKINFYEQRKIMENNVKNDALSNRIAQHDSNDSNVEANESVEHKYNVANSKCESKLSFNEYLKPIAVNKIHIPEKFTAPCSIPNVDDLDVKQFKHFSNRSSKREIPRHLLRSAVIQEDDMKRITKTIQNYPILEPKTIFLNQTDDNDSGNDTISSLEENEVKQNLVKALSRPKSIGDIEKMNSVPKRFFKIREYSKETSDHFSHRQNHTSPICEDHIVPEVNEYKLMSVAERRKIFAKQPVKDVWHTSNSFPDNESAEILKAPRQFQQFKGLSVLNGLGSLKETEDAKISDNYVLSTAKSLPNISSVEDKYVFHNSVKERKNFWEQLSSSSTSLNMIPKSLSRSKPKKITEEERLKLIWQKPKESEAVNNNTVLEEIKYLERAADMCRSANNIAEINCDQYQNSKKYKSLDDSLDNCTVLSIDERKKLLLQQNYDKEKIEKENLGTLKKNYFKVNYSNNIKNVTEERNGKEENSDIIFNPVVDKIKKYDIAYNRDEVQDITKNKNVEEDKIKTIKIKDTGVDKNKSIHKNHQNASKPQKLTLKSHFRKAITYFKNLEAKSIKKTKSKYDQIDSIRRYSFDVQLNKNRRKRKGGSLNLPNVSERFSINNLYEDVFRNKRGRFKGAANRSSLVEALATFSRKEYTIFIEDNEDDIRYDIFNKRAKGKRRKSIRSAFDVYY